MSQERTSPSAASPRSRLSSRPQSNSQISGMSLNDLAGPVRLPRPITTAELHHELEQEQEAIVGIRIAFLASPLLTWLQVNRLTRELTELRARASSVSSTTSSSASEVLYDSQPALSPSLAPTHLISVRSRRSSSNISSRSSTGGLAAPSIQSQASVDRARDAIGSRSRHNSIVPPNISSVSAPAGPRDVNIPRSRTPSMTRVREGSTFHVPARPTSAHQMQRTLSTTQLQRTPSSSQLERTTSRQDELAAAQAALESVRKENEMLTAKVRELEARLRNQNT